MGRKYGRFCIGGMPRSGGCFKVHALQCIRSKPRSDSFGSVGQKAEFLSQNSNNNIISIDGGMVPSDGQDEKICANGVEVTGNKILIVVDSSLEAKGALEWALSHTVQSQDTVVLLHVAKPSKQDSTGKVDLRATEVLHSMKNTCERRKPGVKVEIELLQGKERGPTIVEEAKRQRVSLLVLGQKRKRSIWWRIMRRWARNRIRGDVVDYCIENASCMTIAVRRKNKKLGGYLITTKRHKNFWLLA
ncbi:Universal stress protein [Parasponia andersonii]|uniref:Universal stress protein n=1 Tax=Parasponia andersonii TaxID=3476 RepID=A0A2P5BCC8_PARAD|nr:Universal stress protein [Parasponia andersonii]